MSQTQSDCLHLINRGLPVWLHNLPGCEIRTANDVYMVISLTSILCHQNSNIMLIKQVKTFNLLCSFFQSEMKNFTTLIVDMMKKEKLFASQGGPIIIAQVYMHIHTIVLDLFIYYTEIYIYCDNLNLLLFF